MRFELTTPTLARSCSTPELRPLLGRNRPGGLGRAVYKPKAGPDARGRLQWLSRLLPAQPRQRLGDRLGRLEPALGLVGFGLAARDFLAFHVVALPALLSWPPRRAGSASC